jgi:LPS-assembly protein
MAYQGTYSTCPCVAVVVFPTQWCAAQRPAATEFAPIFDTAPTDFGLAEIFTANRFVGGDRLSDMNRVTAGLTTRFIDPTSGDERARFVVAQEYYFKGSQVTMPGDTPPTAGPADLIAGASFKLGDGFSSEQAVEYDQSTNALTQATVGLG